MYLNKLFENKYVQLLSIHDHLRECTSLYEQYKLTKNKENLDKELTDLFLILQNYLGDKNLIEARIKKFREKEGKG